MTGRPKVLIVEDDPASLVLLEYLVNVLSLEAVTATNVAGAKKALVEHEPQIAILDVMLPDGDGIEILAEIRYSQLPVAVAMLTATHDKAMIYRCNALKPEAIFRKPLDANAVGEWLGMQRAIVQLRDYTCMIS